MDDYRVEYGKSVDGERWHRLGVFLPPVSDSRTRLIASETEAWSLISLERGKNVEQE